MRMILPGANQTSGAFTASGIPAQTREEKVFCLIDKSLPGIEIGPSHSPFAPKRRGFKVTVVDHASAADLRDKYQGHPIDLEAIEEVDVVARNGTFVEQIPPGSAQWIIASHVIEHTIDMIGFLNECQTVLAPGGMLSLVVPDMRVAQEFFITLRKGDEAPPHHDAEAFDTLRLNMLKEIQVEVSDAYAMAAKKIVSQRSSSGRGLIRGISNRLAKLRL